MAYCLLCWLYTADCHGVLFVMLAIHSRLSWRTNYIQQTIMAYCLSCWLYIADCHGVLFIVLTTPSRLSWRTVCCVHYTQQTVMMYYLSCCLHIADCHGVMSVVLHPPCDAAAVSSTWSGKSHIKVWMNKTGILYETHTQNSTRYFSPLICNIIRFKSRALHLHSLYHSPQNSTSVGPGSVFVASSNIPKWAMENSPFTHHKIRFHSSLEEGCSEIYCLLCLWREVAFETGFSSRKPKVMSSITHSSLCHIEMCRSPCPNCRRAYECN
jgi:hypothetical protein